MTHTDMQKDRNDMLDSVDKELDTASDAGNSAADEVNDYLAKQWNKLKASYYDAVADNADAADEKFENRMKAIKAKAKAAGRDLH